MDGKTFIIAHRGASYEAPENTLASVILAWEQEADAVEIDVHLSKDDEIIVIHDYDTQRTTGSQLIIRDHLLPELKILDAGSWKSEEWKDIKIPVLDEILLTVPPRKKLFIEIKCGSEILTRIKKILDNSSLLAEQIIIMDFDLETVIQAKEEFPDYKILWLYEFLQNDDPQARKEKLYEVITTAAKYGLNGVNFQNIDELDKSVINKAKSNGLECYSWTIDEPVRAKYLIDSGINGITTNRPGWMREQLRKLNK